MSELLAIAPGVRLLALRTPTVPPATHTNCWVLGHDVVTVIDPASPYEDEQARLSEALRGLKVERIVLTHHHRDHVGGVEALHRETGAPVQGHADGRFPFAIHAVLPDLARVDVAGPAGGDAWVAIHTPGHADGHLCLHRDRDGLIITGDMVAGVGTILLDPPEGHLATYLASLERMKQLRPTRLLPAHGPVLDDAMDVLDRYVAHRHMRTAQVREALDALGSAATHEDIARRVYGDSAPLFLAARQVRAHREWLEQQDV